ncbi:MAG TPA: helix-turn-helix domain-containing protein [Acidiferrobacter sp.]|nr:helix-turn-helix domain-containing protein [Acidiferrobacter sp.]
METPSPCPVSAVLKLLGGPWTTHVLWALQTHGTMRFSVLKRAIPGISSRLLTERLRRLTAAGFIDRHSLATVPPQVSYGLTAQGHRLGEVLAQLQPIATEWTEQQSLTDDAHAHALVLAACEQH